MWWTTVSCYCDLLKCLRTSISNLYPIKSYFLCKKYALVIFWYAFIAVMVLCCTCSDLSVIFKGFWKLLMCGISVARDVGIEIYLFSIVRGDFCCFIVLFLYPIMGMVFVHSISDISLCLLIFRVSIYKKQPMSDLLRLSTRACAWKLIK